MNALPRLCALTAAAVLALAPRALPAQAADSVMVSSGGAQHSPVYVQMRTEALTTPPEQMQFEGRRPRVWGAIMELGLGSGGVATLVVYADGTTSLYSSAGGGILGVGQQRGVRGASDAFLRLAQPLHAALEAAPAGDLPVPAPGRVRFYLRTNAGIRTAEAGEEELKAGGHRLSPLFTAGQAVLDEVRPRRQTPTP
jgi:hypothetical protein